MRSEFPNTPPGALLNEDEENHNGSSKGKQNRQSGEENDQFADKIFHVRLPKWNVAHSAGFVSYSLMFSRMEQFPPSRNLSTLTGHAVQEGFASLLEKLWANPVCGHENRQTNNASC